MEIKLPSGRSIGENHPPFIIAEVGSNWLTFDDCKNSIAQAKQCGADAVKFQAYTRKDLYGIDDGTVAPGTLPLEWLPRLAEKAKACGIEFMCSAFSPELIDAVDPYVNIHKVASAESTHKRMLKRLRDIGKPVLLSTGAHGIEDVMMASDILDQIPHVLMYCVSSYPARRIDLFQIHTLRTQFGCLSGYSDHSTDVETVPVIASSHGACVIEKHVTFIDADTPDSPHSLTAEEFKRMVYCIKNQKYQALLTPGDKAVAWKAPTPEERPMVLRHNRRLIALKDIRAGERLVENQNFGIYRSLKDDTHAFSPMMIDEVSGRVAKRAVKAGDGIGPGDV